MSENLKTKSCLIYDFGLFTELAVVLTGGLDKVKEEIIKGRNFGINF